MSEAQTIQVAELPQPILEFLANSTGSERPTTIRFFADDAKVDDQGESFSGTGEIQGWLNKTTGLFEYTLETVEASVREDGTYGARNRLTSEVFPGGETHSTFVFGIDDGRITYLTFV